MEKIICPHCKETIDEDDIEFSGCEDDIEIECPNCCKGIFIERRATITYKAYKADEHV